jgi:hypothetical protein
MIMRPPRKLLALGVSLGLVATLCACERLFENSGDVSVSRDGDAVRIAFCEAIDLETVVLDSAHRGLNGFVETVYIAKGAAKLPAGFVLSTDADVEGMIVELRDDPRLDEANQLSVTATSSTSDELIAVDFNFQTGAVPTDRWLRADGSTSDEPC